MFDKKVTFQEVSPKVPSYALMFMLEGMTYKATVKVPEGMESKDIEVQAWTNQFDRNNPQGEWHAVVLKFMGPVPGSKTLLRFGCTDIITSAWDFHFTFRARVKSNSEPAMEWVWAGGWQVNGFVHVEPPRNGDHWTLGPDWNHIMGCIHLGNFIAASNASSLGFTHVLNVADNLDMVYPKKDVIYKKVSMQDGAHNPIEKPKLKESIDWLLENDRGTMDFEVGSWTSSKKADDLTNKLFGQSFTKLKKSEKPLTGVLAEEEKKSKMKKKKKKGIVAAGGTSVQRPKAKTKEDAIALAKLRKNKKRKMKQKLARYHAKVQEQTETADSASSEKGKALGSKKQTKHKKGLKQKGTPSEKSDSSQSPKKSKIANGNSVITDSRQPKKSPKNMYKHLAQQRKAETSTEKAKTIKLDEKNTVQKVFNDDTKAKVRRKTFDDDSDDNALDNSEGGRTLPKMKAKKKAFSENNELTPHKKVGHSSAVDTNESDFVKKKKGTGQVSPLVGAKEALMKFKNVKKKSQDSSLIEVDGSKVEVVDLQAPSDSERPSKKQKFKRNREEIDGSVEPPQKRKKHKRQMTQDLVQLPLTTKQSKKGKFNLDKLNALLHKEPSGTSVRKEKAVASPETDPSKSLKDKMKTQLNAARFRFINEQLYTSTSEEAVDMMKEDPEAFNVYHEGFQAQVSKWPTNPVNLMIAYLKQRPKSLVVADLGCGDGLLAESVKQKVYSFDLVAKKKGIIACDIANVPLEDNAVDISIFCLSLMGTNLVDFILEAHRITKMGGMLLVAEVLSRFDKLSNFIRKMGKLGFTLVSKDNSNTMFVWMEFKKTGSPEPDRLPQLELAPCSYKKR